MPVLYLILPPMHKTGNKANEIETMQTFKSFGCSTRLSEEDLNHYSLSNHCVTKIGNREFVYRLADVFEMNGKKWKKFRNKVNEINTPTSRAKWGFSMSPNIEATDILQCEKIYKSWLLHKGRNTTSTNHKSILNPRTHQKTQKMTLSLTYLKSASTQKMIAFCIAEKIGKHIIMNTGFRDYYDKTLEDPNFMLHYIECKNWSLQLEKDSFGNSGQGRTPTLVDHKTSLMPIKILQLYNLDIHKNNKLDKKTWDQVFSGQKEKNKPGLFF